MNKLTIIGNLTRDPEHRTTSTGKEVTSFSVAVNRRGDPENADFFRVNAWGELGNNCNKYLRKGKKVCVIGPVSLNTYTGSDGQNRASMEITAIEVEFLTPKDQVQKKAPASPKDVEVYIPEKDEDLPF